MFTLHVILSAIYVCGAYQPLKKTVKLGQLFDYLKTAKERYRYLSKAKRAKGATQILSKSHVHHMCQMCARMSPSPSIANFDSKIYIQRVLNLSIH